MSERDRAPDHHRIGSCTYELHLTPLDDGRLDLSLIGCDADGQVVADLSGALPAAHVPAIGRLLTRSPTGPPAYNVARIRERHPNAYRRWPPEDDERLTQLYGQGWNIALLAAEFGRNHGAIRARLTKLDLLDTWLPPADLAS